MGYPEFFHFMFSPEDRMFGIEPCKIDDGGAYRLPDVINREHYDLKSKDLVRFIYQTSGWGKEVTYRIPGVREAADSHTVYFDLRKALKRDEPCTIKNYKLLIGDYQVRLLICPISDLTI